MSAAGSDRVIIGIDFGTAHSGVSWARKGPWRKLRVNTDWPNPYATNTNSDKVPSVIIYSRGRVQRWAFEIGGSESLRWVKILLEAPINHPRAIEVAEPTHKLLLQVDKNVEEVVTDYLKELLDYTKRDIGQMHEDKNWEKHSKIKIVLTVPVVWSGSAKDKILKAAKHAVSNEGSEIELVSEPEAAVLATLEWKDECFEVGDALVVCDAGAETVDLISYKILSTNPLKFEECAARNGGLCGSVFLNKAFEKYVKTRVGEEEYNALRYRSRVNLMNDFEKGLKSTFMGDSNGVFFDLFGAEDNEEAGIRDQSIQISSSAIQTIFNVVFDKIDRLVEEQINAVREKNQEVKAILLIGGFGESKYLHKRLQTPWETERVRVLQVSGNNPKAINAITPRISRGSYGVVANDYFGRNKKTPSRDQMHWMLRRGDQITAGKTLEFEMRHRIEYGFRQQFFSFLDRNTPRHFPITLYYCPLASPPTHRDASVQALCQLDCEASETIIQKYEFKVKDKAADKTYIYFTFKLCMALDSAAFDFLAKFDNEEIGCVRVPFMDVKR